MYESVYITVWKMCNLTYSDRKQIRGCLKMRRTERSRRERLQGAEVNYWDDDVSTLFRVVVILPNGGICHSYQNAKCLKFAITQSSYLKGHDFMVLVNPFVGR